MSWRSPISTRTDTRLPYTTLFRSDTRPGRGIGRARFMSLVLSDWVGSGSTVILTGATGCGKTWLACALAQYACRQGRSTRSQEHTSELQSLMRISYAVFCWKKKTSPHTEFLLHTMQSHEHLI